MISSFITGRLTKLPEPGQGKYLASMACAGSDRSVRLVCKRKHAEALRVMPLGSPLSVAGLLEVLPVQNERGEPRAYLRLEVTAILDVPQPTGLLDKLFKGVR